MMPKTELPFRVQTWSAAYSTRLRTQNSQSNAYLCDLCYINYRCVGCSNDAPFRSSIWKTDTTGVESKSRRGHTSLSRRKKLTVLGDIVTTTEMSKHHHHHKHKQGANQMRIKRKMVNHCANRSNNRHRKSIEPKTYVLYH